VPDRVDEHKYAVERAADVAGTLKGNVGFVSGTNLHFFSSSVRNVALAPGVNLLHHDELPGRVPDWLIASLKLQWLRGGECSDHVLIVESKGDEMDLAFRRQFRAQISFYLLKTERLTMTRMSGPAELTSGPDGFAPDISWHRGNWNAHPAYQFGEADVAPYQAIHSLLTTFGDHHVGNWRAIQVALRAFMNACDTDDSVTRLLESFTSIEALIGDRQETTFKIRYRAAAILGDTDDDRVRIFTELGHYYDDRSLLVHGSEPDTAPKREAFESRIRNPGPVADVARKLVLGMLKAATSQAWPNWKSFREGLDANLLHTARREAIRAEFGFQANERSRVGTP
jgi:hypothetical protein